MITIEAENYEQAIKKAKAQKRAESKQVKIDKANSDEAHLRSYANLGYIVSRLLSSSGHLRNNLWSKPTNNKPYDYNSQKYTTKIDSRDGEAEITFYRYLPTQLLLDGAGFPVAIETQDLDSKKYEWQSLGIFADRSSLIEIPKGIQCRINRVLKDKASKAS